MVDEDGHKQMFNLDLGGVTWTLNPGNDFEGSHQTI
jgi:hypothetical protein